MNQYNQETDYQYQKKEDDDYHPVKAHSITEKIECPNCKCELWITTQLDDHTE